MDLFNSIMLFQNNMHKERFINMMAEDNTVNSDNERISLFYILSGNEELYRKRHFIYNINEHRIKLCLNNSSVDLSSGMKALVRLGFNLYNGYHDKNTTPRDLFWPLDDNNKKIALNAIFIRYNGIV